MKYALHLLILISLCLVYACGSDCDNCEPIFTNQQMEYVNLGEAQEQLFRVDSIIVRRGGQAGDTMHRSSILKEIIHQDDSPNDGVDQFAIERWTSVDHGLTYSQFETGTYEIRNHELIRTYGNLPFKMLELPYQIGKTWDGAKYFDPKNSFISIQGEPLDFFAGEWNKDFEFISFSLSETIGGVAYDSVITVQQGNHDELTEVRMATEKYAWNIGLIYREMKIFDEECNQVNDLCRDDLIWELRGNRGFSLKQWRIN